MKGLGGLYMKYIIADQKLRGLSVREDYFRVEKNFTLTHPDSLPRLRLVYQGVIGFTTSKFRGNCHDGMFWMVLMSNYRSDSV